MSEQLRNDLADAAGILLANGHISLSGRLLLAAVESGEPDCRTCQNNYPNNDQVPGIDCDIRACVAGSHYQAKETVILYRNREK